MGKGARVKALREEEKPKTVASISFDIKSDRKVSVSGPIQDPTVVFDTLGKGMLALAAYYAKQQKEFEATKILTRKSPLILPH